MVISFKLNQILSAIQNTQGVGLQILDADPIDVPDKGTLYSKNVDGYAELFFMDDYGLVTQITDKGSSLGGGSGGSAENFPIITDVVISSANTFNISAKPGKSSTLSMTLSDGNTYTATSPYAMDINTNGAGGLEGSLTVTASTAYFVYAVPHPSNAGEAIFIISDQDPDPANDNGPTNYAVWRYIGHVYYKSDSSLRPFVQDGSKFIFTYLGETALNLYSGAGAFPTGTITSLVSGSVPGGGTLRTLGAAIPINIVNTVDLQGGMDSDSSDDASLTISPDTITVSIPKWTSLGSCLFDSEVNNETVNYVPDIPVVDNELYFKWVVEKASGGFYWTVILRAYRDKFLM